MADDDEEVNAIVSGFKKMAKKVAGFLIKSAPPKPCQEVSLCSFSRIFQTLVLLKLNSAISLIRLSKLPINFSSV